MDAIADQRARLNKAAADFVAKPKKLLIDGEWVDAKSGKTFSTVDPATGLEITRLAEGDAADVDVAARAARRAFEEGEWPRLRPRDRQRLLLKLADLVEAHADELAEIEALDNGKPVTYARFVDVNMAVDFLRYMAGWATKIEGTTLDLSTGFTPDDQFFAYVRKEAVGVVGQIIPWNFPLVMAAWKLGPALATGCTVLLKPAEQTSLSALRLGELVMEAGFPKGVVNIITGFGGTAGAAIVEHPEVDKIAFTGSTAVGKLIGMAAMKTMKRVSLELGGKSPVVVMADANLETAIPGAAMAVFFNMGQVCTAGSRLFVERKVFDQVTEGVAEVAKSMKIGAGLDPASQLGPLVSAVQRDRVMAYIQSGLAEGGRALTGGQVIGGAGCFVEPTVFVDVNSSMKVVREEIFGPVVVAQPIDDIANIPAMANDTIYGLGASIWSNNLSFVHRLVPKIKAGTVWVNCHNFLDPALPFGGYKQSGVGREMGRAVLDLYTESKSVLMQI
ncbi:aldehyde dehydrogenase family protein [Govanella unica]|uniref:Aldehyde dehydrogenase family protein n=1 Tax=Govanella unica TaxID=2975056 RepID=A0A9X3TVJ6_9PROT|nr:aldehyde dehydrogenase family protein [Govania unica]MDA5192583.1 aldehyde dehydrogenase family protein [Govania unica]